MDPGLLIALLMVALAALLLRSSSLRPTASTPMSKKRAPAAESPAPAASPAVQRRASGTGLLDGIKTWGYQLQKVNAKAVAASPFDLMVIDYSKDGSDDQAFTPGDVQKMRVKPDGGRRFLLAYMSIGEAESYRYYWDASWATAKPGWLLGENPDWKENFTVCYWDPEWQQTFCGSPAAYLDKIIAAGFDGVYLDKCDVFEDLKTRAPDVARTRPDLEGDMVAFVSRLSQYAKAKNPNFVVVMQNAELLLEQDTLLDVLDGVAKESLLFGEPGPEKPNDKDEISTARELLDIAKNVGRTVFVVEYLNDPAKISEAVTTLDAAGYIVTISNKNRLLNQISPDPASV